MSATTRLVARLLVLFTLACFAGIVLAVEPAMIEVTGRVFLDGEAHPAKLTFLTVSNEKLETRSDEKGNYTLRSREVLKFVEIDPETGQPPHFDFFTNGLTQSQQLDFHVKVSTHSVRVVDAITGNPIPDARVMVRNIFDLAPAEAGGAQIDSKKPQKVVVQSVKTGADGRGALPGLRPGEVELQAGAEGYSRDSGRGRFEILANGEKKEFELRLAPESASPQR